MGFDAKKKCATFFKEIGTVRKNKDVLITTFKCQCGITRTQDLKKGYSNLISHIYSQHPDWQEIMGTSNLGGPNVFVNKKANTIFAWLEWIVMENLPFSFIERDLTRKNTKLDALCVDSLSKYMRLLNDQVEEKIAKSLPEKFGIIIDGWSEGSTHYIALFAEYSIDNVKKNPLLAIAPPFDESSYDAPNHKAFIGDVLDLFCKPWSSLSYLVADNCPTNTCLADLLGIPLIGCASHRFNLACQHYLKQYESSLVLIHGLMTKLRNLKKAGQLRKKTTLQPVPRNDTRWSSTHNMLKRYV
jgi:hypothetical protein